MTITYSFFGNGNSTYAIGSLVDWHSSALIADQIQVLKNDVELVHGADYEINEGGKALVLTLPASGNDTITINRVTPDTFFSTLETAGAASATSTLSNDQQLMNRIQEVEADIVVAASNTTIQDDNGNLFGILKPGTNVGFSYNSGDGSLTISSSGGGGDGSVAAIDVDFAEGIGPQSGTSFVLSAANTGFATTVVSDDLQAQINQLNLDLGGYVQTSGFNTLFDSRFATQIADYDVKTISSPNGTLTITENGAGNFELETAGGQSVSSLQGQAGDLLMDMRVDGADTGVSNRIGLDGCTHNPGTPTFAGVTPAGTATGVNGWSWIHDTGAGSFVSHKPLSGTRHSTLIGGRVLTIQGVLDGDANDIINLHDTARIKQKGTATDRYHIRNQSQEKANEGKFLLKSGFRKTGLDRHVTNKAYLLPIDGNTYDVFPGHCYPEHFFKRVNNNEIDASVREKMFDHTSFNPGGGRYTAGVDTYPVFYPGFDHSIIKVDPTAKFFSARVANAYVGDTARHWQTSGINEPYAGSGRIREDAPARLFNIRTARDWTSSEENYNGIGVDRHSYMDPITGSPVNTNKYSLWLSAAEESDATQGSNFINNMNMLYVPANAQGGLVTLEATFNHTAFRARGYIMLFCGLREADKNIGPKEGIIPVAGYNQPKDDPDSFGVSFLTHTLRYTFDMSDGLPRYFGFVGMFDDSSNSFHEGVSNWSLSRADGPQVDTYHNNTSLSSDTEDYWEYARGTYDPYVQEMLNTYSIDQ